jgi:glutamate synthase domain-containing protein 2
METLDDMIRQGMLISVDHAKAVKNYAKSASKGVLKVLSKMGISTIASYTGAQIFEAIGLNQEVIDKYFCWTPSRIGGVGIDTIAKEVELRHRHASLNSAAQTATRSMKAASISGEKTANITSSTGNHSLHADRRSHEQLFTF